jgi:hypothetical protein
VTGQLGSLQEIVAVIQHYVDLPAVDIPDVMAGASYEQLRDEDIEQIALDLRQHWKLGIGPCVDMVSLMERVGSIEMGTVKLDGLCCWPPTRWHSSAGRWTRPMRWPTASCTGTSPRKTFAGT